MGRPDASHDLLTYDDLKGSPKSRFGSNREIQTLTGNLETPKHRRRLMGLCHNSPSMLQCPATTKYTMLPDFVAYL